MPNFDWQRVSIIDPDTSTRNIVWMIAWFECVTFNSWNCHCRFISKARFTKRDDIIVIQRVVSFKQWNSAEIIFS